MKPGFRAAGLKLKKSRRITCPNQPVSDPQFWRNLAAKARAKANQTIDDRTKRLLLRIAESHERVAKLVEPGGTERSSAGVAADGGKRHVGHPGPKPVQVYRVQSW